MRTVYLFLTVLLFVLPVFAVTVYDIQYSDTGPSPLNGETVTVSAMVSAAHYSGDKYFISDPEGGLWRGIYVYDYTNGSGVSVGDYVTLTAEVTEYYDLTELKTITSFSVDSTGGVPVEYETTTGAAGTESLESVLISLQNAVVEEVISDDEWKVNDGSGSLLVKKGFDYTYEPSVGDTLEYLKGVVFYGWSEFFLEPRDDDDIAFEPDTSTTPVDTTVTAIADIQANPGAFGEVTIEGIITVPAGTIHGSNLKAYIQDGSGKGMMIFDYTMTESHRSDFVRGNKVKLSGQVTEYNGITELTDFTYEITGTGELPAAVDLSDLSNPIQYEGTWSLVEGTVVSAETFSNNSEITVSNGEGNELLIKIWSTTGINISTLAVGNSISCKGVAGLYNSVFQLLPALSEDLSWDNDTIVVPPDTSVTPIADIQANPGAFGG